MLACVSFNLGKLLLPRTFIVGCSSCNPIIVRLIICRVIVVYIYLVVRVLVPVQILVHLVVLFELRAWFKSLWTCDYAPL